MPIKKPKKNAESTEKEGDEKSIEPSGKAKSKPKKNTQPEVNSTTLEPAPSDDLADLINKRMQAIRDARALKLKA